MTITLKTLAKTCKVDISTVSRALRNDPRVKEVTRDHIRATADKLGYQPNITARQLQSGKNRTVWFIIPSMQDVLANELVDYVTHFLQKQG